MTASPHLNTFRVGVHFWLRDFMDPTTGEVMLDARLLTALDELWSRLGQVLMVTSGYRTPAHNAHVGGVPHSRHLTGEAADVVCDPQWRASLIRIAESMPALLVVAELDHVHLELRRPKP